MTSTKNETSKTSMADDISKRLPKLIRYARYLTRNEADAEDLLHDCVERAIVRRDQFRQGTNLDAWLKVVMRNIFLNRKRHDKTIRLYAEREARTNPHYVPPSQDDHMELREVIDAMDDLSANHKKTIDLLCIKQVGYGEASEEMQVPRTTAKTRLFRARERLRTRLAA